MLTRRQALAAVPILLARPAAGWAQTPTVRRVAWFGLGRLDAPSPYLEALRGELLVVNVNTAKGVKIPPSILLRADQVIE